MAVINFTFTTSPQGYKAPTLGVVACLKGTDKRKPMRIEGLTSPDYAHWDKKQQRFLGGTQNDVDNNNLLDALRSQCEQLQKNSQITTPQQFIDALRTGVAPKDVVTFGDFLNSLIDEMRNGTNNKRPSKNYQVYINLLHKLEREGNIINVALADVCNKHFIAFSDFILSLPDDEGRTNYYNLMKLFKQVHTKASKRELNQYRLVFPYAEYTPVKDNEDEEKRPSLSLEQYAQFVNLDLSKIYQSGINVDFYKSLYHNFCVFLYEMKMRPVDALKLHTSNIVTRNGRQYFKYVAEKKKNSKEKNKTTYTPITSKALEIINQYKGQSSKGYIFPFALNAYDWDYSNATSWNKWNNRKQRAIDMVNQWLKKVADVMGIDFPLVCYTFRHSTLSHACMSEGANYMQIALEAATSPDMLLKHYVSNVI